METSYRSAAGVGAAQSNCSIFEPVTSFQFAFKDPRWSDRELRVIVKADSTVTLSRASEANSNNSAGTRNKGLETFSGGRLDDDKTSEIISQADVEIIEVPVNSVILAKESSFFRSLFGGNGFRDSNLRKVDIHINPEEKTTFPAMIECIYTNNVSLTRVEDLIGLWALSERFLVHACSQICIRKLKDMPLDLGQAVRIHEAAYLSNPSGELRLLIHASTQFLVRHFKKMGFVTSKFSRESEKGLLRDLLSLAQSALTALLSSDNLEVEREEIALSALILWVKENTSSVSGAQAAMTQMAPLIRFPFIKANLLTELIQHAELAGPTCQGLVIEGLKFCTASDEMKRKIRSEAVGHRRFEKRKGYLKPINSLIIEQPRKQAVIHFHTSLEDLESLEPSGHLTYETFRISGSSFALQIHHVLTASTKKKLGMDLRMCTSSVGRVQAEFNVSVWSATLMMFVHRFHAKHTFQVENTLLRCLDLFGNDLKELLAEKSQYVCEGRIFINAELSIRS